MMIDRLLLLRHSLRTLWLRCDQIILFVHEPRCFHSMKPAQFPLNSQMIKHGCHLFLNSSHLIRKKTKKFRSNRRMNSNDTECRQQQRTFRISMFVFMLFHRSTQSNDNDFSSFYENEKKNSQFIQSNNHLNALQSELQTVNHHGIPFRIRNVMHIACNQKSNKEANEHVFSTERIQTLCSCTSPTILAFATAFTCSFIKIFSCTSEANCFYLHFVCHCFFSLFLSLCVCVRISITIIIFIISFYFRALQLGMPN